MSERRSAPVWIMKFLSIVCPKELLEEIEGDLLQKYERNAENLGSAKAKRRLVLDVIGYAHPAILLRNKFSSPLIPIDMIFNYLKMAWRNLAASKFYSTLNLAGLTLGLAVGLLILLWVNNELSYDDFNTKKDQLYQMSIHLQSNGEKFAATVVQAPIAPIALKDVTGVENAVRFTTHDHYSVFRYKEITLSKNVLAYTDPSLFKMFDYKLLQGNADKPFDDAYSVILTGSCARRYFGNDDPMGQVMTADNETNFTVTGVVADFPENGWLQCDMLFSTELNAQRYLKNGWGSMDADWGNYGWTVFLQLRPGTSIKSMEEKLSNINYKNQPNMKPVDAGAYGLQPLKDLHLHNADGTPSGISKVRIFSLIAGLILLVASINYVNLSTARALMRSKEVSVRKIVGGTRKQLFTQFIVQTLLFFGIALVLAFAFMILAMPLYNSLSGKHLQFSWLDKKLWQVIGATLSLTLLVASFYPAMLLSSFNPVTALKGKLSWGIGHSVFRKTLVTGQFAFSVGLIICTLVMGRQLEYLQEKDLGYDKANLFSVNMNKMRPHFESARTALLANPAIEGVASGDGTIFQRWGATLDVDWEGKDPNSTFFIHDMKIDEGFLPLLKFNLTEGVQFTGGGADSTHFILNETAVKDMGIKDPVGKSFRWHQRKGTIIGVVKDFNFVWAKQKIEPFVFTWSPDNSQIYIKSSGDPHAAVEAVNKIWTQYNPGAPFDYKFIDEAYKKQFDEDDRTSKLFRVFTAIAIAISCLGLLGLAAYAAQIRLKEIGIRKVLGASASAIVLMLSANFLTLIVIAIAIALPASWYIMTMWMKNFAYKSGLPVWIFFVSSLSVIAIALLTIGYQSVRAALENPVKTLKSE